MAKGKGDGGLDRLGELSSRIEQLEARVALLEAGTSRARAAAASAPEDETIVAADLPQGTLALVGRTLLVLAGAYVVRALTDGQAIPVWLGVALGVAYAAFWQLRADREAEAGRVHSAAFHDVASSLIAFPLVWEAATRFGLLPAPAAAVALVAFFALGLGVAWHRWLPANAVVTTCLALASVAALLVSTHDLRASLLALAAMLAALEWLASRGAWPALRWPAAAVLDGAAFLLVAVATRPQLPEGYPPLSPAAAALALIALPAVSFASVAARTLRLGQPITAFDVAQGAAAVVLGFAGGLRVLAAHDLPGSLPGLLALLLGLFCYGAAFAHAGRRPEQGAGLAGSAAGGKARNFYFFSTAGFVLTLGATGLVVPGTALSVAWALAGLAVALLGRRFDRMTLRTHGALFLVAASLQTGLLTACARALGGLPGAAATPGAWATAAAAATAWFVLASDPAAPRSGARRVPLLLLALVAVLALATLTHAGICASAGGRLAADAGAAAASRTAVLAGLALVLAAVARRSALPELGWLVYPILLAGGLKLMAQDLKDGRPSTLVMSLALYGIALTLAPRWLNHLNDPGRG